MIKIDEVYQDLLQPSAELVADVARLEGDILILWASGKMGSSIVRLVKQDIDTAGVSKKVTPVSRFSEAGLQQEIAAEGIETISANLLEDAQLQALPDAKNILYLAGTSLAQQATSLSPGP